ncbi:glycosyltransferase [Halobiforma nitratireducens]|uniref:Family 2 glycosyl transferase n=1 Tax=Halobiforma nitratireducens JCM 10879 TaxID=1227454 RepID=M0M0B6_9EURY|nr:glycosyltransferase [Halobiforma nitratireducens]EMA37825.1 family 2 glycosyl transferase [Halobiforma nitratireducens JCM 10879]
MSLDRVPRRRTVEAVRERGRAVVRGLSRGGRGLRAVNWRPLALFLSALVPFGLLIEVMGRGVLYSIVLLCGLLVAYFGWSYYVIERAPQYRGFFGTRALTVSIVAYAAVVVHLGWLRPSAMAFVHFGAVLLIFVYYWFIAFIALFHDQIGRSTFDPEPPYPDVTVLIPAYNEEGYVGRTIQALLDADYPEDALEIVAIDDGSTDGTYAEASAYAGVSDRVRVVSKENGGKYSALNYGLLFASNDVIVTVDADSLVASDALKHIVAPFGDDPETEIGAVASNVTIWNRDSLVTRCQQLEYTIGVNIYRRALDYFGIVMVVPGCLGAYRREVLDEVFGYDPDTLTEDFDVTMKVLRAGYRVTVSDARVYTEAPATWRDLYRQRLRWYRGNYMTILKHWQVVTDARYDYLNRIALPFRLVEMFFIPAASFVIFGYIVWLAATGSLLNVLAIFVFFTSIVLLIAALGIQIEGEDWRLLVYTPLLVVGYKQFHDALNLRCMVDVFADRNLDWTSATRVEQVRGSPLPAIGRAVGSDGPSPSASPNPWFAGTEGFPTPTLSRRMTTFTVDDVGKPVESASGDILGTIVDVDDETASVEPDPDVVDSGRAVLGWESDDVIPLAADAVREITDDAVRLEASFPEETLEPSHEAGGDTGTNESAVPEPAVSDDEVSDDPVDGTRVASDDRMAEPDDETRERDPIEADREAVESAASRELEVDPSELTDGDLEPDIRADEDLGNRSGEEATDAGPADGDTGRSDRESSETTPGDAGSIDAEMPAASERGSADVPSDEDGPATEQAPPPSEPSETEAEDSSRTDDSGTDHDPNDGR